MANFEVFKTDNNGGTFSKILDTVEGIFPCGGETMTGRIFCFFVSNSDTLKMIYSDDQGVDWSIPATIVSSIMDASIGWEEDECGKIWLSYWKDVGGVDKHWTIYTDDRGATWSDPIEVKTA